MHATGARRSSQPDVGSTVNTVMFDVVMFGAYAERPPLCTTSASGPISLPPVITCPTRRNSPVNVSSAKIENELSAVLVETTKRAGATTRNANVACTNPPVFEASTS